MHMHFFIFKLNLKSHSNCNDSLKVHLDGQHYKSNTEIPETQHRRKNSVSSFGVIYGSSSWTQHKRSAHTEV